MKVKLTKTGRVIDLTDPEAQWLIDRGHARPATGKTDAAGAAAAAGADTGDDTPSKPRRGRARTTSGDTP